MGTKKITLALGALLFSGSVAFGQWLRSSNTVVLSDPSTDKISAVPNHPLTSGNFFFNFEASSNSLNSTADVFRIKSGRDNTFAGVLFRVDNATSNKFIIKGDGLVGIGTTTPSSTLHIYTAASSAMKFDRSGTNTFGFEMWAAQFGLYDYTAAKYMWRTGAGNLFLLEHGGNVGIGTTNPLEKLQVAGNAVVASENSGFIVDDANNKRVGLIKYFGREGGIWRTTSQDFEIGRVNVTALPGAPTVFTTDLYIDGTGNVGIGTMNTSTYKLSVNGNIRAKDIVVETGWSDFVFENNYKLLPLEEVRAFIKTNKHLPGIPAANEIVKNGLKVAEAQTKMMQKIEELTLYLLEQNEKLKQLETKNQLLEQKLENLQN